MPPKRKRPADGPSGRFPHEGSDRDGSSSRPSPHRPENLPLAQANPYQSESSRGGSTRRGGRGGSRGGRSGSAANRGLTADASNTPAAQAMPPPSVPTDVPRPVQQIFLPDTPPAQLAELNIPFMPSAFTLLTDQVLSSWPDTGKESVVKRTIRMVEEGDLGGASAIFQDLLKAVVSGKLSGSDAGSTLRAILAELDEGSQSFLTSLFLDQFSENLDDEIKARPPLRGPLRAFLIAANIDPTLIRELLVSETLVFLGFTRSNFQNRTIRHATNVLYRQSAFNLLREESEGYSKLMTEYFSAASIIGTSATETWEKVKALIGTFNMDPGRVLDVTLDVFSTVHVRRTGFVVKTLRASSWWPMSKQIEGVETEQYGFTALPGWAEPDVEAFGLSSDEREQLAEQQRQRDIVFWDRVREKGVEAFFELGGRRILSGEDQAMERLSKAQEARALEVEAEDKEIAEAEGDRKQSLERAKEERANEHRKAIEDLVWITTTHTFPASGNTTAAQILGFKFRFYASDLRSLEDERILPNLYSLAALLIKIGFISLRDLYPHLYPADSDMPAHREKLEKEKEERERTNRSGSGENALTKAAPLIDDTPAGLAATARLREEARATPSRLEPSKVNQVKDEDAPKAREPDDQKGGLLSHLLLIGAIPESLYILSRFPWLIDLNPDVEQHATRLLRHMVSKVYDDLDETPKVSSVVGTKPMPTASHPYVVGQEQPNLVTQIAPSKKTKRHMHMENSGEESDWAFYWEDWADNVPVCQTVDDVFTLCGSLLNMLGLKIGHDGELMLKLVRIGSWSLTQDQSKKNLDRWYDLTKRLLFPALSFTKNLPVLNIHLYEILQHYPLASRFNLYAEAYEGQTSRRPEMKHALGLAVTDTKDILKRLTKDNVKAMSPDFAKLTYANAGIVFSTTLSQLERYENIIEVFVDCGRLFEGLTLEILSWSLLSSLGRAGQSRMQADGILTSSWLKRISLVVGQMHASYTKTNIKPILHYLALQLREGSFVDLEILEETIKCMAGIVPDNRYSEEQAGALAGGPVLRRETLNALGDRRPDCRRSAQRLMVALKETSLETLFLIVIAQGWQTYASQSDAPIKVTANNLDKIRNAFTQYLEFLRFTMSAEEFDKTIPDLQTLVSTFELEPRTAFQICRESLRSRLADADKSIAEMKKDSARATPDPKPAVTNGDIRVSKAGDDVEMQDVSANGTSAKQGQLDDAPQANGTEATAVHGDTPMEDASQTAEAIVPDSVAAPVVENQHAVLIELTHQVQSVLPEDVTNNLSMEFYIRFWSLYLGDIFVPSSGYTEFDTSLSKRIKEANNTRGDERAVRERKEKDKAKCIELKDKLAVEFRTHIKEKEACISILAKEKDQWFAQFTSRDPTDNSVSAAIADHCFFPRLMTSVSDARYVGKFLWQTHNLATPGFRTHQILDYMLSERRILNLLFQCTEAEAQNLGHFLSEVFKTLRFWHTKRDNFEAGAWGRKKELVGFVTGVNENSSQNGFLDYEEFRRNLFQWHANLHSAFKACISSDDDTQIRNVTKCMSQMQREFPMVTFHGTQILALLEPYVKEGLEWERLTLAKLPAPDIRQDVYRLAQTTSYALKSAERHWITPQAFRISLVASKRDTEGMDPASARTPRDTTKPNGTEVQDEQMLDAPAAEPGAGQANGVGQSAASEGEQEDGEVDEKNPRKLATDANMGSDQGGTPTLTGAGGAIEEAQKEAPKEPAKEKQKSGPASDTRSLTATDGRPGTPAGTRVSSRPRTPDTNSRAAAPQASLPTRPETQTPSHQTPRPSHNLPGRPDVVVPSRERISHHPGDRGAGFPRHALPQDSRRTDGRLSRPDDMPHYGTRGRRDGSPGRHSRQRTPERGPPFNQDRRDGPRDGPSRDSPRHQDRDRLMSRETRSTANLRSDARAGESSRDRHSMGTRLDVPSERMQSSANAPDRPRSPARDRTSQVNAERPAGNQQTAGTSTPTVNSQRQALIEGEIRSQDRNHDQRPVRPRSPARGDDATPQQAQGSQTQQRGARDAQPNRGTQPPAGPAGRDRQPQAPLPPPSGPRNSRSGPTDSTTRSREPVPSPRPTVDNGQSLHPEQEFAVPAPRAQEQAPTPATTAPEIPSGPRDGPRGRGRGARTGSRDFRGQEPISPAGPAPPPNTDRPQFAPRDSLRAPEQSASQNAPSAQATTPVTAQADTSGVHPSRLALVQPTLQTNNIPTAPASQVPSSAPSGPRSGPRTSSGGGNFPLPSPTGRAPPSGPMSAADRQDRDRRFSNFQNAINQAGSAPSTASERGPVRGQGRAGNAGPLPSGNVSGPPSSGAPPMQTAPQMSNDVPAQQLRPEPSPRREPQRGGRENDDRPESRNSRRSDGARDGPREQRRDDRAPDNRYVDDRSRMQQPPLNDGPRDGDGGLRRSLRSRDDGPRGNPNDQRDGRGRDDRPPPRDTRSGDNRRDGLRGPPLGPGGPGMMRNDDRRNAGPMGPPHRGFGGPSGPGMGMGMGPGSGPMGPHGGMGWDGGRGGPMNGDRGPPGPRRGGPGPGDRGMDRRDDGRDDRGGMGMGPGMGRGMGMGPGGMGGPHLRKRGPGSMDEGPMDAKRPRRSGP